VCVEEIAPCNIVHFDEAVPHNSVCDQSTTHVTSVSSNIMTVPHSSCEDTQSSGAPVDFNHSDETCCATLSFVVSGRSQVMSKPTFNLLPYWEGNLDAHLSSDALPVVTCMMEDMIETTGQPRNSSLASVDRSDSKWPTCMQNFMILPSSWQSMFWELFGSILIMFDVVMIPMQPFDLALYDNVLVPIAQVICIYWSLDIPRQFFSMYEDMGVVERRPEQVARHYLQTWFVTDVIVVALDWMDWIEETGGGASRSWRLNSKIGRASRVLRVIRLVRVVKAWKTLHVLIDYVQSPYTLFAYKVLLLLVLVLLCVHYVACYIYTMTLWLTPSSSSSWISESQVDMSAVGHKYFTALHWSLAQAGFTSSEVHPRTILEKGLAAVIAVCWVFMYAYVCTQLTVWTLQLRDNNLEIEQHEAKVRKFMLQRSVHSELGNQVVRFFRLNYRKLVVRVMEKDIKHFKDLPVELRIALHKDIYRPKLSKSPTFDVFDDIVLHSLCHVAMDDHHHLAEGQVFAAGDDAVRVLYLASGVVNYYIGMEELSIVVNKGTWIAEVALWCQWKHLGGLVAVTSCNTIDLDIERFLAVIAVAGNKGANLYPARYFAQKILLRLQELEQPHDMCLDSSWLQKMSQMARKAFPVQCSKPSRWFRRSGNNTDFPVWQRISSSVNFLRLRADDEY